MDYSNIYKQMFLLRRFEEVLTQHYLDHKVFSFVHFYTGAEASAVGVCSALRLKDKVFGNHRSHGHYLAKGGCPFKLAAEMLGKSTGCASGNGGSMHPVAREVGFMGTSPILGSSIPLSVGAAFAEKHKQTGNVCVGFTGDGASEEGLVTEAINLACAWELPHITVIENNNYSVLTPVGPRRGIARNNKKFYQGLGAVYLEANGRNVLDVINVSNQAFSWALRGQPVVLEVYTHRFLAHSTPLPSQHHELKQVMESEDCLIRFRELIEEGSVTRIEKEVNDLMIEVMKFAIESLEPDPSDLTKNIYV